jgi:drug/metabolite transporter (DMT)-like permease
MQKLRQVQGIGMFAAASIWGTWVLALKPITVPGYILTCVTCLTGALALIAGLALQRRAGGFFTTLRDQELRRYIFITAFWGTLTNIFVMVSLQLAIESGGSALIPVIRSFSGVIMSLVVVLISRQEQVTAPLVITGVVSTLGALLIFTWGGLTLGEHVSYLALLICTGSNVTGNIYALYQKSLAVAMQRTEADPWSIVAWQSILTSVLSFPLVLIFYIQNPGQIGATPFLYIGALGVTHVALAFILRLNALRTINAQQSVIIGYMEYVISIALSILFLSEQVTLGFFIGTVLIIGSAVFASLRSEPAPQPAPAVVEEMT